MTKQKEYRLLAFLHGGKCVRKPLTSFTEVRKELQRERELRQYYSHAVYEQRNGKLITVNF